MKTCNNCAWLGKQKKTHFYICHKRDSKVKTPFPHGETRKACSLYAPRYPPLVSQTVPEGMRFIEDLRGRRKFRNSEWWIIGSDPNLDYYPDDFFDDKFSIALNMSCVAFPESTFFYISGNERLEWLISEDPGCVRKTILPLELLPARSVNVGRWEKWGLEFIYMKAENKPMTIDAPDYESTVKRILSGGPYDFVLARTSAHWAAFAALVLGAKKVFLVGCSHRSQEGGVYAQKRGMSDLIGLSSVDEEYYPSQSPGIIRLRRDTIRFARAFEKYGIEIMRHRFKRIINKFIFEKI